MFYMLLLFNLIMTLTFIFMNHPLSMGLILLIQTLLISLISSMYSYTYWFSYILFLVMVGGMLVLFIYMTSLASNEMFNFSMKIMFFITFSIMFTILSYFLIDYMIMNPLFKNSNMMEMLNNFFIMKNENLISLNMIYNQPNNLITLMLVNYLFLTLIAVVKITDINYGPLRQKF
uniref:NADH-ubiquinone oxidoreductase chain 6 n=1 Tax=Coleoptera sp. ACP-2013 TaxID=2485033 RepID=A0A3G3MEE8_9COLE|nr:NADH dehydrogenase subunit 6 [Coleoptera sp. ACP-2013]AYR05231.1 NADH dehydrogenase subunit 6 [Coleoptera sp. ACP-2013]